MSTIYIVTKETGEYEDMRVVNLRAFTTRQAAERHKAELEAAKEAERQEVLRKIASGEIDNRGHGLAQGPHDDDNHWREYRYPAHYYYTVATYHIDEIELEETP